MVYLYLFKYGIIFLVTSYFCYSRGKRIFFLKKNTLITVSKPLLNSVEISLTKTLFLYNGGRCVLLYSDGNGPSLRPSLFSFVVAFSATVSSAATKKISDSF